MLSTDRLAEELEILRHRGKNLAVTLGAAVRGDRDRDGTPGPLNFARLDAARLGDILRHRNKAIAVAVGATAVLASGSALAAVSPSQPSTTTTAPTTIYDSIHPATIPAGARAAVYADGAYAASPAQVAGHPGTLWIDTTGADPHANVLDVEPGDATPAQAATWVSQKLTADPGSTAVLYTMKSEWPAAQQAVSALPSSMQSHVKWWIADPTGVPHVVPGSAATQWSWGPNYDITTATPGF